jgi:hypothetical protein
MKIEGFTINYNGADVLVKPVYIDDMIHYKVSLPGGDKLLRLEEREGPKLSWAIRNEDPSPEADIIGKLIEARIT